MLTALFLFNLALKGAFVLLVACAIVCLLRRASAAVRHWVWAVAMASLLAMPLLMCVVPAWQVSYLQYPNLSDSLLRSKDSANELRRTDTAGVVRPEESTRIDETRTEPRIESRIPIVEHGSENYSPWSVPVLLLWLGGSFMLFVRLLCEIAHIWWVTWLARPIEDSDWLRWSQSLVSQSVGSRRVSFFVSDRTAVPLTWGTRKPVVLLPATALSWTRAQQRAVLLHELTHIRRRDYLINLLAQAGLSVHWFNPLAWFAANRMLIEREKACDDQVLAAGTDPMQYAHLLLDVARGMFKLRSTPPGALSMARHSELESRLRSILDNSVLRSSVPRFGGTSFSVLFVCMLPFFAAMQFWVSPNTVVEADKIREEAHVADPNSNTLAVQGPVYVTQIPVTQPETFTAVVDTLPIHVHQALHALSSNEPGARAQASCDLGRWMIRPAIPDLIGLLQDDTPIAYSKCSYHETLQWNPANYVWKEPTTGESAAIALAAIGGSSVDALVHALENNDATVRRNASWALGEVRMHENLSRAVGPLLERLGDEDWWVRKSAAWALGETRSPDAIDGLLAAIEDGEWPVREQVVRALGELGDPAAESAVKNLLSDPEEPVRQMAAWALNEIVSRRG